MKYEMNVNVKKKGIFFLMFHSFFLNVVLNEMMFKKKKNGEKDVFILMKKIRIKGLRKKETFLSFFIFLF